MAELNIKRFVDINILTNVTSTVNSTRDIVVLFTTEGKAGNDDTISSLSEWTKLAYEDVDKTTSYVSVYFNNGGNKLRVIQGITTSEFTDKVASLSNEEIVVALVDNADVVIATAKTREADSTIYGINEKILLTRVNAENTDSVANLGIKYSNEEGAEMTIAAYLSNINVYGTNTVKDYCYTKETLDGEESDDDVYKTCLENNMNVDMYLANAVRNLGGNLKDGSDLVNKYVLIILHQTLTDRLVNLLTSKIKGSKGVSAIYSTIAGELDRYSNCGYLTTDKIWQKGTKTVNLNGKTYTIIDDNTALTLGYYIFIAPLTSLTDSEKAEHKAPYIYIIVADSYGLRSITINGEVI